jgi:hypothetical protein
MTNKDIPFSDLTKEQVANLKIEFAPGCFDQFEGTQEELDELVNEIKRMVETGELSEKAELIDIDALMEEDPEWAEAVLNSVDTESINKRTLQ